MAKIPSFSTPIRKATSNVKPSSTSVALPPVETTAPTIDQPVLSDMDQLLAVTDVSQQMVESVRSTPHGYPMAKAIIKDGFESLDRMDILSFNMRETAARDLSREASKGAIDYDPFNVNYDQFDLDGPDKVSLDIYKEQKQFESISEEIKLNSGLEDKSAFQNRQNSLMRLAERTEQIGTTPKDMLQLESEMLAPKDIQKLSASDYEPINQANLVRLSGLDERELNIRLQEGSITPIEYGSALKSNKQLEVSRIDPEFNSLYEQMLTSEPAGTTPEDRKERQNLLLNMEKGPDLVDKINSATQAKITQRVVKDLKNSMIIKKPIEEITPEDIQRYRTEVVKPREGQKLDKFAKLQELRRLNQLEGMIK